MTSCVCYVWLSLFFISLNFISKLETERINSIWAPLYDHRRKVRDMDQSEPFFRGHHLGKKMSKFKIESVNYRQTYDDVSSLTRLNGYAVKRQLDRIAADCNSNVTIEVLGKTIEYNDIVLMKISHKDDRFRTNDATKYEEDLHKRVIFIAHGLDVAGIKDVPAFLTITEFKTLLSYYEQHLDKFDIFLIPLANPDGAQLASAHKNLSPQEKCYGVHVDRNFDIAWKNADKNDCSSFYPGPSAFSEPESRAVKEVLHKYSNRIVGYLNVHASTHNPNVFKGDAVLYPKGYTDTTSNDDKYIDLRSEVDEALRNATFKAVTVDVEPLHSWYGKVIGTSVDYASAVYGVPYSLELCMQPYTSTFVSDGVPQYTRDFQAAALEQLWRRVLDVIFNTIHKGTPKQNKK